MADSDVNLKVKVDTKEASASVEKFSKETTSTLEEATKKSKKHFEELFNPSIASELIVPVGLVIAGVGLIAEVAKKAFESLSEIATVASEIKKVNDQFDFLAEKAGASGVVLRESFSKINNGVLETKDVLKAANTALTNLTLPAESIVKNFEAAKRAAIALGGDTVTNFESINTAIATGNTRVLRQIGLFIDAGTATEKYANSLGIATKFLSDGQKQAAIFEAIQNKVAANFSNVDLGAKSTAISFKQFGTSAAELGDSVALGLNKIFGPAVQALLARFSSGLSGLANEILVRVGTQTQKAVASQELFNKKLEETTEAVAKYQEQVKRDPSDGFAVAALSVNKKLLASLEAQKQAAIDKDQAEQDSHLKFAANSTKRVELTDQEIKLQLELLKAKDEFSAKVLALESASTQSVLQRSTNIVDIENALAERQVQIQTEAQDKIVALDRQHALDHLGTAEELAIAKAAITDKALQDEEQATIDAHQRIYEEQIKSYDKTHLLDNQFALESLQNQQKLITQQLANASLSAKERAKLEQNLAHVEAEIDKIKVANRASTLATIATLSRSNNQTLATIGKAAGITQIAIDTPVAISKALAAFPPPFNFIAAGIVGIAEAAQAAAIAGVPLATGITQVPSGFPNDSFQASLTSGERVLSVAQNRDLTDFLDNKKDSNNASTDSESSSLSGVKEILSLIANRLGKLENTTIVNIGNKEIVREVREGLRSGQVLAI